MKGDSLLAFVAGAAAGLTLGLLFAPEKGEETRRKLKETVGDAADSAKARARLARMELTADYVEARIDDLKLRTAKGLSLTLGKLLYMLLVLFIVSVILTALAIGGVMWIGELIGSYAAGAGIVAAVFAVILVVVILLRKRLFRNTFVPMFIKLFFDEDR